MWSPDDSGHTERSCSEWVRLPSAEDRFSGGTQKKVLAFFAGILFREEPEKQRADVPQDAGKTPSACLSQLENTWLPSNRNDLEPKTQNKTTLRLQHRIASLRCGL